MIWGEELSASLDQSAGVVAFHRVELTRTQQLAQVLADKVNTSVEQNEKILDSKLGGSTGWGDRGEGGKGDKREQARERRPGRGGPSRGRCLAVGVPSFTERNLRSRPWWSIPRGTGQSGRWGGGTVVASPTPLVVLCYFARQYCTALSFFSFLRCLMCMLFLDIVYVHEKSATEHTTTKSSNMWRP